MHKRILCLVLTAILLLSLIPAFALPSQAASNMTTGEAAIAILKEMEGFRAYAYFDYYQYSIGYGSACGKDEYPNGITEEQADVLLREELVVMEADINRFANRYGILFSQNQFDALMLFTYNVGSGWVNSDGVFRRAVIEDKIGNSFIYAMTLWSTAGNELSEGLLKRRMIEADMYLNSRYSTSLPGSYTHVTYNNNGGTAEARAQGFDSSLEAYVMSTPTREGYKFLGWYTAAEGGSWVTQLTSANAKQELFAHWQSAGTDPAVGTAASYQVPADKLLSLDYYTAPGGTVVNSLNHGANVDISADYVDAKGLKWGRISNGCWVKLGDPRIGTGDDAEVQDGLATTITGDYVNVRTGPGTGYPVVSGVVMGDVIYLTQVSSVDDVLWGKFRAGWLCLQYTDYSGGLPVTDPVIPETPSVPANPTVPETPDEKDDGVVSGTVNASKLNIRSKAGTNGYLVGTYLRGDRVEILERTMVGSAPWGRTDRGWICLTYVKLDEAEQETPEETTAPTEPETTVPKEPEQEDTQPETQEGVSATVISKNGLNIRSGPGTQYATVGSYGSGAKITILEQKTVGGVTWGRTVKGWVCMQYVQLSNSWSKEDGVYGVVISSDGLNIRSGAGVGFAPVGSYASGSKILIFEQVSVAGQKWGRTDKGWVCMDYVQLEQSGESTDVPKETQPETTTEPVETTKPTEPAEEPEEENIGRSGTITATRLNIRKTPGTNGTVVGAYVKSSRVVILEQKQVNGTTWGRTDKGWISLAYVQLDPVKEDNSVTGTTGVITATSLCIRKGPGTGNAVVGSYKRGQTVIILETTKVGTTTWGRTDKGWICMDYVKTT